MKGKKGFQKAPQGLDEAKSRGMINLSIEKNLIKTLRTRIQETNLLEDLVTGIANETREGDYKNALKLVEIVREPEGNQPVVNINQAVQVNQKALDEAVNIINELR